MSGTQFSEPLNIKLAALLQKMKQGCTVAGLMELGNGSVLELPDSLTTDAHCSTYLGKCVTPVCLNTEKELNAHRDKLEALVRERTAKLETTINLMAGRENRMRELKDVIGKLQEQIVEAGMSPVADDPAKESGFP